MAARNYDLQWIESSQSSRPVGRLQLVVPTPPRVATVAMIPKRGQPMTPFLSLFPNKNVSGLSFDNKEKIDDGRNFETQMKCAVARPQTHAGSHAQTRTSTYRQPA